MKALPSASADGAQDKESTSVDGDAPGPTGGGDGGTEQPSLYAIRPVEKKVYEESQVPAALRIAEAAASTPATSRVLHPDVDAIEVNDVLSPSECEDLIKDVHALGLTFWHPDPSNKSYRNADTVEVQAPALTKTIWERMRKQVPRNFMFNRDEGDECVYCTKDHPEWPSSPTATRHQHGDDVMVGMGGRWRAVGLDSHILFARYETGGHFSPHTDGYVVHNFDKRSIYTVILYLNTVGKGGGTALWRTEDWDPFAPQLTAAEQAAKEAGEEGAGGERLAFTKDAKGRMRVTAKPLATAQAERGRVLAFRQDVPHEGIPVEEGGAGVKWIIRMDIVYERVPAFLVEPRDLEAFQMMREAEVLEGDGGAENCRRASDLNFRARKRSLRLRGAFEGAKTSCSAVLTPEWDAWDGELDTLPAPLEGLEADN